MDAALKHEYIAVVVLMVVMCNGMKSEQSRHFSNNFAEARLHLLGLSWLLGSIAWLMWLAELRLVLVEAASLVVVAEYR